MPFSVTKEFTFAAAHMVTAGTGTREHMHGHNYRLRVTVTGPLQQNDMVMDFDELGQIVRHEIIVLLDHTNLNDRFEQPTCERIAQWIFQTLKPKLPQLTSVKLFETDISSATYSE